VGVTEYSVGDDRERKRIAILLMLRQNERYEELCSSMTAEEKECECPADCANQHTQTMVLSAFFLSEHKLEHGHGLDEKH